jgi:hypothetical protein
VPAATANTPIPAHTAVASVAVKSSIARTLPRQPTSMRNANATYAAAAMP